MSDLDRAIERHCRHLERLREDAEEAETAVERRRLLDEYRRASRAYSALLDERSRQAALLVREEQADG